MVYIQNGADGADNTQHSKTFLSLNFQEVRVLAAPLPHFLSLLFLTLFTFYITSYILSLLILKNIYRVYYGLYTHVTVYNLK